MRIEVHHRTGSSNSYRSERVRSLFNVDAVKGEQFDLEIDLPTEGKWQIGVVVGPSGSGKSSVGHQLVQKAGFDWYGANETWGNSPIVDEIGSGGSFDEVTGALAAVGLGTVPSWLRPYSVLSNGEQFRAGMARLVVERPARVVVDEFTSVLDRQIARIGAMAFAKTWRRGGGQVVLLTPHHDVLDWLEPDWVFDTGVGGLLLREHFQAAENRRRSVRGRVGVLEI